MLAGQMFSKRQTVSAQPVQWRRSIPSSVFAPGSRRGALSAILDDTSTSDTQKMNQIAAVVYGDDGSGDTSGILSYGMFSPIDAAIRAHNATLTFESQADIMRAVEAVLARNPPM